jgi:hypothetical protein
MPPTGLNRGTRLLLIDAASAYAPHEIVARFFAGTWADVDDYAEGLVAAGRTDSADAIYRSLSGVPGSSAYSLAILTHMPDTDFLSALEAVLPLPFYEECEETIAKIHAICDRRGVPYRLGLNDEAGELVFEWAGDPLIQTEVLGPALSALDDPRLAGGPQDEFVAARAALRDGTPQAYRRAVAEACNAVESGLRVLLAQNGREVPPKPQLAALLRACRDAGLLPGSTGGKSSPIDHVLGAAGRFGNERGRHGAGEMPHDVKPDEAEAVVSSAAVALTFIAGRLPPQP